MRLDLPDFFLPGLLLASIKFLSIVIYSILEKHLFFFLSDFLHLGFQVVKM